jgi:hypothetical protein
MDAIVLTSDEQKLFDSLPGPPKQAVIKSTNIWIIEWLPKDDSHTGRLLHEWMERQRPRWSYYCECSHKLEVLSAINRATDLATKHNMIPVLHFESHGNKTGLVGPADKGDMELLTWDELNKPLQMLNLATHCNLVVFVAACIGFAGIKAFTRGPLAPAVALVGPNAQIQTRSLLYGTKEFYRRMMDENPRLEEMAVNASRESGNAFFDWEPFAVLAYDAFAEQIIFSRRESQKSVRIERIRKWMYEENKWSSEEIEHRLSFISPSLEATSTQKIWDTMFMIDKYPENRERFGVNWFEVLEMVSNK